MTLLKMADVSPLAHEAQMALLEDLKIALENVMRDALPGMKLQAEVIDGPRPGVFISMPPARDRLDRYPDIHNAKAVLRPSLAYRKLLGLGVEGD